MGLLTILIQAFVVGLSGALAPGPLLTYNIQLSYKQGFWSGPRLILGHAILELLLIMGLILGLKDLIEQPLTRIVIGLCGGLMLAWMGYGLVWKESRKPLVVFSETAAAGETELMKKETFFSPVMAGLFISLANPYWALWWASVGLAFISKALLWGWLGVVIFFCGHILADLLWYSLVSWAAVKGRQLISKHFYRWLMIGCGIFLLYLAIFFIYDAIKVWISLGDATELFKHPATKV